MEDEIIFKPLTTGNNEINASSLSLSEKPSKNPTGIISVDGKKKFVKLFPIRSSPQTPREKRYPRDGGRREQGIARIVEEIKDEEFTKHLLLPESFGVVTTKTYGVCEYTMYPYLDPDKYDTLEQYAGKQIDSKNCYATVVGKLEEIATVLSRLHEHGILHRDIKPQNIVISKDNPSIWYLIDFDIAGIIPNHNKLQRSKGALANFSSLQRPLGLDDNPNNGYLQKYGTYPYSPTKMSLAYYQHPDNDKYQFAQTAKHILTSIRKYENEVKKILDEYIFQNDCSTGWSADNHDPLSELMEKLKQVNR